MRAGALAGGRGLSRDPFPGRGAAHSGAPLIRDRSGLCPAQGDRFSTCAWNVSAQGRDKRVSLPLRAMLLRRIIRQKNAATGHMARISKEDDVAKPIALNVNGKMQTIEAEPDMPLLYALRGDLGMRDPRFGCGLGQCGACTVLLDGEAVRSCLLAVDSIGTRKITTLTGIGTPEKPHKVQAAFIEEQVPQCGYCLNGWVMTSVALLEKNPHPTDAQIRDALSGLKCRCGTHVSILRAVKRAAQA
jgi:nicotinate dehydrogenase subunit A